MCGIAGIFDQSFSPVSPGEIKAMLDLMVHRGPDDEGIWTDMGVGIGHRRLSIIDLSRNGKNPIFNEDRTIAIILNGEIYNYRELKAGLAQKHEFKSRTDTEVLLHLYEEEGEACITRLNGMFGFAIWDGVKKRLLLGRDRFGVKPLYYTTIGARFVFASEIKAFLALSGFNKEINHVALSEHLTFQNMLGSKTLFKHVHLLDAGHYMTCERDGVAKKKYWDLVFNVNENLGEDEWAEGLKSHFNRAVERQLVSDVPVGSFLSGGMDTGAISAVAAGNINQMHTFTCGFKITDNMQPLESFYDESAHSADLARTLNTTHHQLFLDQTAMPPVLPKVIWHLDEPRCGISYQIYYTSEMIKKFVTVVLSGVGGDELFAGYPWRYERIQNTDPALFNDDYYSAWVRLLDEAGKEILFTAEVKNSLGNFSTRDSFADTLVPARDCDNLNKALYFDFKTFLNGLLIVDDKLNMAHSVEARTPFLDNELVDFIATIPSGLKLKDGMGKYILRKAMGTLLPHDTLYRRKQGFTPPDQTWYRTHHLPLIKDLLLSKAALSRGYFRKKPLENIIDEHVKNVKNHRFLLWSLMCFEWWNRLFIDNKYKEL